MVDSDEEETVPVLLLLRRVRWPCCRWPLVLRDVLPPCVVCCDLFVVDASMHCGSMVVALRRLAVVVVALLLTSKHVETKRERERFALDYHTTSKSEG